MRPAKWHTALTLKRRNGSLFERLAMLLLLAGLSVMILLPLFSLFSKAVTNKQGEYNGLDNFIDYFSTPALLNSLQHTVYVSLLTAVLSVFLGFLFAYALTRTNIPGKMFFKTVSLLMLFAPTMMVGIGLTYLFGNQGLITTGFFDALPLHWDIGLYGPTGIVIAEVLYTFPQACLILVVSLSFSDFNLYEAAKTMGAGKGRIFLTVTIPSVKYGLISSFFVCFTLAFTDFGAPQVVGGGYNVLATEIYKQVIGQQNMGMGATVGIILTLPAILAFIVDRFVTSRQHAVSARAVPYRITANRKRDGVFLSLCLIMAGMILLLIGTVFAASVIKIWPYNLAFSLKHYDFSKVAGGSLQPFWTSLRMSAWTALIGTVVTFVGAYLIEKTKTFPVLRQAGYFLSILPLALPGIVLGLSYIFFFNKESNPMHGIYGTIWILVLANIAHFYSVAFVTATSALKKLDREIETASDSLGVPRYKTLLRVTIPLCLPAVLEMAMYFFINSMVTVSAVMFLYAADLKLASVSIVNMEDAGDIAPAAAMSALIVLTNIGIRLLYEAITHQIKKRTHAWQTREH
ncbi:putative 2-aminoethylphosphonate ABC transporter permease subunit [Paenibacillus glycanilyticus]|uniref:putative 2-aminoethylphosphonate ABC transporter permease subunit n=1 Tax=Paenibacillus glycanilyticus TaxID=126569 RepID=UPI00203E203D|nr:putative 2-aminoethylphosphonate ABC transporter permease subunit [Paenibacillus glycanilyticus]MCM3630155.1 putative 2-aminoethylphosphonate ABC transporter permease subunit [Paenibacillus glycanilyticus]